MEYNIPQALRAAIIPSGGVGQSTLFSLLAAAALVALVLLFGGGFGAFFNLNSIIIVLGGTAVATLISYSVDDMLRTIGVVVSSFLSAPISAHHRIHRLLSIANQVRREGTLVLQSHCNREPDPFFRKGLELVLDGVPEEEVKRTLELEIMYADDPYARASQVLSSMGSVAPAMGLIGTLIGLVQMLQHLDSPEKIGPAMAIALLTTLYGALLANVLFLPLAGKLQARGNREQQVKKLTLEGLMEVARGVNPRLIETRLQGFIAPDERQAHFG